MAGVQRQRLCEQLALGREVAIDRAGRDLGRFRHHRDLRAAEADLGHHRAHRLQDAVALVLQLLLHPFGPAIGHGMNLGSVLV